MKGRAIEPRDLPKAIDLYREGTDWTPATRLVIQEDEAAAALCAPNALFWVIEDEFDVVIGLAGFERINWIDRTAEPYIAVMNKRQGTGRLVGDFLFERGTKTLGLRRIQTVILKGAPSEKILIDLGFELEGTLKSMRLREGKPVDGKAYAWVKE